MSTDIVQDIRNNKCKYPFFDCMREVGVVIHRTGSEDKMICVCLNHAVELSHSKLFQVHSVKHVLRYLEERKQL